MYIGGWVCASRSSLNAGRSKFVGCCQDGSGDTGSTWVYVEEYLRAHRPPTFILENVKGIAQKGKNGEPSDLDHIITVAQRMGYDTRCLETEASEYGSFSRRDRLYIVGFCLPRRDNKNCVDAYSAVLPTLRIPAATVEDVFGDVRMLPIVTDMDFVRRKLDECKGSFCGYHLEFFQNNNVSYPPDIHSMDANFQCAVAELSERQVEVLALLERVGNVNGCWRETCRQS